MKLLYCVNNNFGDELNPLIFNKLLPGFFDDDNKDVFLGIGSIIGFMKPETYTNRMTVFSSGLGYGAPPSRQLLNKYDFRCVRGPLTAEKLGLSPKYGICDGAILLPEVIPNLLINKPEKKYKFAYMPHELCLKRFSNWEEILNSVGIHLINPHSDVDFVINEIQSSEILLAEAMHGAIVADILRVPWIPVKSNKIINEFKWVDYCSSLDMKYEPNYVKTLWDFDFVKERINDKFPWKALNSDLINTLTAKGYELYQNVFVEKAITKEFTQLKNAKTFLSDNNLLQSKKERLLEILFQFSKENAKL